MTACRRRMTRRALQPGGSQRIAGIQSPIIPDVARLIRENPGTISLGQGVVYYGPPPSARTGIQRFFEDPGNHKYSGVCGLPELIGLFADKLTRSNGLDLTHREIVVTAGSNMAFSSVLLAITEPGDEVIIARPYYFNHEMAIRMAGCTPVEVSTDDAFQLDPARVKRSVTEKTRALVTISPNNPCGVVYPQSTLRELTRICEQEGIYHISDEAYEDFVYDGARHFSPASADGSGHCISLYSMSKAWGFASWRIGYMVIPSSLLAAVLKIQDTLLICPPVISQYAAIGALQAGPDYPAEKLPLIRELRHLLLDRLESLSPRVTSPGCNGAFYVLLKVATGLADMELVRMLIQRYSVAVIPGSAFGLRGGCYLRVAFAALERTEAEEGIDRLVRGIADLTG